MVGRSTALVVAEYGTLNGGENSFLCLAPSLRRIGWDLSLAVPMPSPFADRARTLAIRVHPWNLNDGAGHRKSLQQIRNDLTRLVANSRPALLHANSLHSARIAGPLRERLGIPLVGHLRDIMKLSGQAIADLQCADRLVAVSHSVKNNYAHQGIDPARIQVIYNGVNSDCFCPRPRRGDLHRTLGLADQAVILLSVGQIGMRKGVDVGIGALARLLARGWQTLHLVIAGERHSEKDEAIEFEQQLRARIATPPLNGRVHLLGRRAEVNQLMNEADILVHPARQEPFGRVLLEAAASGLPIVATDTGGTPEMLLDREHALLVRAGCPQELSLAIEYLLRHPKEKLQMADRARLRVVQRYSHIDAAKQVHSVYRQCSPSDVP